MSDAVSERLALILSGTLCISTRFGTIYLRRRANAISRDHGKTFNQLSTDAHTQIVTLEFSSKTKT